MQLAAGADIKNLKKFLDKKVDEYNQPSFIKYDPVFVPHKFSKKQDIEIAGFFAAIFAWGNRTTIINKSLELMSLMDYSPHQFITQHHEKDLKHFLLFKHRTFNTTDILYFIKFFKFHYTNNASLESAFIKKSIEILLTNNLIEDALNSFYQYFFSLEDAPKRTFKHIASPQKKSTCKRLNMYLRWMVRNDPAGVDFGIWKKISPASLVCPVDVHVARVARHFNLLNRKAIDWLAVLELTENLKILEPEDPVKYDFALFGLGVIEKF